MATKWGWPLYKSGCCIRVATQPLWRFWTVTSVWYLCSQKLRYNIAIHISLVTYSCKATPFATHNGSTTYTCIVHYRIRSTKGLLTTVMWSMHMAGGISGVYIYVISPWIVPWFHLFGWQFRYVKAMTFIQEQYLWLQL